MNAISNSTRRVLVLTAFSIGLAATGLANAAQTQFVGPRNTIPRAQSAETAQRYPIDRLHASREEASTCSAVRIVHHGHPSKGVDRIERTEVPCGRARLSVR